MKCLIERFDPKAAWRVNFYRVEGAAEPRFIPPGRLREQPAPDFHVPEAFGEVVFAQGPSAAKVVERSKTQEGQTGIPP